MNHFRKSRKIITNLNTRNKLSEKPYAFMRFRFGSSLIRETRGYLISVTQARSIGFYGFKCTTEKFKGYRVVLIEESASEIEKFPLMKKVLRAFTRSSCFIFEVFPKHQTSKDFFMS